MKASELAKALGGTLEGEDVELTACGGLEDGVGTGLSPDAGTFADNNIQHAREESSGELLHRRIGFV